jgi:DNA-binding IclR family transcriptional regulator
LGLRRLLRGLATALDVTEETAYGMVADLIEAGCLIQEKDWRRNRYIPDHVILGNGISRQRTIAEV